MWIFLIGASQLPARAALQCTSLEVSRSQNSLSPAGQTVTLTLHNAAASSAVIVKPDLTFQKLQNNSWRDISDSVFVKPDADNLCQIASGKNAIIKFQIQLFDDVFENAAKSTFRVTPHIEYYLQQDNLLPQLIDGNAISANWNIDNPAAGFGANAFPGHDGGIQMHVNENLLKGRLTLRSAKSTFSAGRKYLSGILNKSDRSGWDSSLNKGVSLIEYDDSGAIRAHPLHIFEVPFWNWELMQFTSAANARKMQMEFWMRGWQLHQTGDWRIKNAFIVPQERIKVLSTILSDTSKDQRHSEGATATEESPKVPFGSAQGTIAERSRSEDSSVTRRSFRMTAKSSVTYLGEDRATQGNWRGNYGNESFILCAMQAPQDVVGGRLLPKRYRPNGNNGEVQTAGVWSSSQGEFHYSVETGDPKEPVRHYIPPNQLTTDDKRALLNPLEGGRRYSSWDDHGETHPFDWKGPDLLVHLDIPKGLHKLSLYFVDWDFADTFRPRAQRIFIEDDNGASAPLSDGVPAKVLSSAYVSHFGNGVYNIFAVRGPCKLRVRITKDASVCAVLSGIFLDEINPKVPLFKGGFRGISAEDEIILNPQTKLSNFAAYIKNHPPANLAQAKARVQHLLDSGEVGLARLAVPAWLHRAAMVSSKAETDAFREAITLFAVRDNNYAGILATQLVQHAPARGSSKVLLLRIGKELMQLAQSEQQKKLRSRAAYPVVVEFYRRLQGEFGIRELGDDAAYDFARAQAECDGYNHHRQKNAVMAYRQYIDNWSDGVHAGDTLLHLVEFSSSLVTLDQPQARKYFSLALQAADKLQEMADFSPPPYLWRVDSKNKSKVLLSETHQRRVRAALAAGYIVRLYQSLKETDQAAAWQTKTDALFENGQYDSE